MKSRRFPLFSRERVRVRVGMRVLCLDIGNTSTTYGLFSGTKWSHIGNRPFKAVPIVISKLIGNKNDIPKAYILISSVVPKYTKIIRRKAEGLVGADRVFVAGSGLKVQIDHNYRHINKLGKDRLLNIYGAVRLYGRPALIFDYGTAVTCDFVSRKGRFEGGLIIPGPGIGLKALSNETALLPELSFPKEAPFLGRDTKGCMKAGVLRGYGAMTDGLAAAFRRRYGRGIKVIATGGYATSIAPLSREITIVDPLLTLKGMLLAFKNK